MFLFYNQPHYQVEATVTANVYLQYNDAGVENIACTIFDGMTEIGTGLTDSEGLISFEFLTSYTDVHIDYFWQGDASVLNVLGVDRVVVLAPFISEITFEGLALGNVEVLIWFDNVSTSDTVVDGVLTISNTQVGTYTFEFVDYNIVDPYIFVLNITHPDDTVEGTLVVTAKS